MAPHDCLVDILALEVRWVTAGTNGVRGEASRDLRGPRQGVSLGLEGMVVRANYSYSHSYSYYYYYCYYYYYHYHLYHNIYAITAAAQVTPTHFYVCSKLILAALAARGLRGRALTEVAAECADLYLAWYPFLVSVRKRMHQCKC